eukprot:gene31121-40470_t
MGVGWLLQGLVFLLVLQNHHTIGTSSHDGCTLSKDLSPAMTAILCAVERSIWAVSISSPAVSNSGCLLGSNRCNSVLAIPTMEQVPPSPPAKAAKNKMYQELAMKAEKVVPRTWWRAGFSSDLLLLSHNDSELPRKLFDSSRAGNKNGGSSGKCSSMEEAVVQSFLGLWGRSAHPLGGQVDGAGVWWPDKVEGSKLVLSALEHFYASAGGIWTGCFKLERSAPCRGALAGDRVRTVWQVRLADFVALQSAYLRLYTQSFGAKYMQQLTQHIPQAFSPSFEVHSKQRWRHLAQSLEPVYTSLRNWMFTETATLIDFGPYIPLVAFPEARETIISQYQRRVLIDVGANGFFASPKPHFSASIPAVYSERYNISFLQIYAEVATGSATDMLQLIPQLVTEKDFVVLKFDVDPNRFAYGPTMEWGFLFSIMQSPAIAQLVDEVYIELHFHFPSLYWEHYHSNWEALDCIRYLRDKGAIVHAWP